MAVFYTKHLQYTGVAITSRSASGAYYCQPLQTGLDAGCEILSVTVYYWEGVGKVFLPVISNFNNRTIEFMSSDSMTIAKVYVTVAYKLPAS